MKTTNIFYPLKSIAQFIGLLICLSFLGCEDYLEIDYPSNQIPQKEVFKNEATATAAVTTMYAKFRDAVLITGNHIGMGVLMGMYSDELDYYGVTGNPMETFYNHQIIASNPMVNAIWNSSYNLVHMANTILEGLENTQSLNEETKRQLRGETLFVRAMVHFYLVNLFGDIPYITTTDYEVNSTVARMEKEVVYENILADLNEAKRLLGETYVSGERTRPNKWAVSALLARAYLYAEQWTKAEMESSLLIDHTALFSLEPVAQAFSKESNAAIWQFKPKNEGDNAIEASIFIFTAGPPPSIALNPILVEEMEDEDLRKVHWIGEVTNGENNWYFPFKYKQKTNTGTSLEYSIVFRLAEQYLIRAEARTMQGDIIGAQQDINVIRQRADLQNTTASTSDELLDTILKERRFELFTEYGHRWFDLRRRERADEVLSTVKPGWEPTNVNFPIPASELSMNPNLNPQNPGY